MRINRKPRKAPPQSPLSAARKAAPRQTPKKLKTKRSSGPMAVSEPGVRDRLLKAGKKHYLEVGAKGFSVRKVAEASGVNLGSFVYYFESRDRFIREVIGLHYGDFLKSFHQGLQKLPPHTDPLEQWTATLDLVSKLAIAQGDLISRVLIDISEGEIAIHQELTQSPPQHLPIMLEQTKLCQKRGLLRSDLDPMAIYVLSMSSIVLPQVLLGRIREVGSLPTLLRGFLSLITQDRFRQVRLQMVLKGLTP